MACKKLSTTGYPRRQWTIVGEPGAGKSTFAAQMTRPLLVIDADHRFHDVAEQAQGDVYEVSENPAGHVDAERIAAQPKANIVGSGVRIIVVDSLISIITPLTTQAIMETTRAPIATA